MPFDLCFWVKGRSHIENIEIKTWIKYHSGRITSFFCVWKVFCIDNLVRILFIRNRRNTKGDEKQNEGGRSGREPREKRLIGTSRSITYYKMVTLKLIK